jgi:undecaprenyl-diphosphatase
MDIIQIILFGFVQGLTEFFPVSSSGHLYLMKRMFGLQGSLLPFFVFLHIGTLVAVFIFFRKDIIKVFTQKKMIIYALAATAVTAAIGLMAKKFLGEYINGNRYLVPVCFLINAVVLLTVARGGKRKVEQDMSLGEACLFGLMQGIAVFPGISRSSSTICALLRRGFEPADAFRFSFLIGIPAILAAFILELKDLYMAHFSLNQILAGFSVALVVGIAALAIVRRSVLAGKFKMFGYYVLIVFVASLFI